MSVLVLDGYDPDATTDLACRICRDLGVSYRRFTPARTLPDHLANLRQDGASSALTVWDGAWFTALTPDTREIAAEFAAVMDRYGVGILCIPQLLNDVHRFHDAMYRDFARSVHFFPLTLPLSSAAYHALCAGVLDLLPRVIAEKEAARVKETTPDLYYITTIFDQTGHKIPA
jgi:sugar phosphate isomerase/epimerase